MLRFPRLPSKCTVNPQQCAIRCQSIHSVASNGRSAATHSLNSAKLSLAAAHSRTSE